MYVASYVHVCSFIVEVAIGQSLQDNTKPTQDQPVAVDTESKQCSLICTYKYSM